MKIEKWKKIWQSVYWTAVLHNEIRGTVKSAKTESHF